jgi:hypothetical protein
VGGYQCSVPVGPNGALSLSLPVVMRDHSPYLLAGDVKGQCLNILHYHFLLGLLSPLHGHLLVTQLCPQPNYFDLKMEASCSLECWYPATVRRHVTTEKTTVKTLTAVRTGKLNIYSLANIWCHVLL